MRELTIGENDAYQRLDKFLKKLLSQASISHIYKLNRKGYIKVNGKKKKQEYSLQKGDILKIYVSDTDFSNFTKKENKKEVQQGKKGLAQKSIVYEDNDLLVINKDPHIIVHPGDFKNSELSLIEQVHDYVGQSGWGHTFLPSLAHRIDKETSGIVLVAKQKQLLSQLVSDFKNHKNIEKIYFVIVVGKVSRSQGTIKKKLLRTQNAKGQNKVQVSEKGQDAVTHYTLLNTYIIKTEQETLTFSTLKVQIETGRMHQIRVHLASIGNPVLGDSKYGDKKINSYAKRHLGIDRQMLHAWEIEIYNSQKKKKMHFRAPLKPDIKVCIKKLEGGL